MKQYDKGFLLALGGVVLTLLWIGIFKFTPTEAAAIRPLVASHPLMIGVVEIVTAIGLVIGIWRPRVGYWASLSALITFVMTLSFLLTLPSVWKLVDGVPVTEFFILKDLVFLGVVWSYLNQNKAQLIRAS